VSVHDDMTKIGEEGGTKALSLMATLMEQNHRDLEATFESLYLAEKEESARWRERCEELEDRLARAQARIEDIFIPQ
jgi:hypothetical protein